MPVAVVDASALVAMLFKERGCETVTKIVTQRGVVAASTTLAEVLTVARRKGHRSSREDLFSDLAELGVVIEPVTAEDALEMAFLQCRSDELRGGVGSLSLGDAACLALGRRLDLPVVASDGTWEQLEVGIKVLPFR